MKKKQQNLIASNSKTPRKHINTPTPNDQYNRQINKQKTTQQQHNNTTTSTKTS